MTTKDERLEQFERDLKAQTPTWGASVRELMLEGFSRGYDEGFAAGVVRGQNYQAQITDMIFNNAVGASFPGQKVED